MKSYLLSLLLSGAVAHKVGVNPISRVAELLQGLSDQIEEDGKTETKLFKKYQCWANKKVKDAEAFIATSESRIEFLTNYIDDVENGRVEFTSERVDLEKEVARLNQLLEEQKAMREQENKDFKEAKTEMTQAINALDSAIDILKTGTEGSKPALIASGSAFMSKRYHQIQALEFVKTQLTTEDFRFLEHSLKQPSNKDWDKLNEGSTFKNKYKHRSQKIQDTLAEMLSTFKKNLKDAEDKEADALAAYEDLKAAKEEELKAAKDSLLSLEKENGARGLALDDAKKEKGELETAVSDNKNMIDEVTAALSTKKDEFALRQTNRQNELAAISQAISILRSDDARDLFKSSFESQTQASFVQIHKRQPAGVKSDLKAAMDVKENEGGEHNDTFTNSAIGHVISAIEGMIVQLQEDSDADLKKIGECKTSLLDLQRKALKSADDVDRATQVVKESELTIAQCIETIENNNASIAEAEAAIKESKAIRKAENQAYLHAKDEDEQAMVLVEKAIGALESYKVQEAFVQQPTMGTDDAPATWEGGYAAKSSESTSVVAMLTMINEDIQKDIDVATKAEKESKADHEKFVEEQEAAIDALEAENTAKEEEKATAEGNKADAITDRKDAKVELDSLVESSIGERGDVGKCDFYAVNQKVRETLRQKEKDGLEKAMTVLKSKNTAA